ncbi:MAG: VPDSG-CTERM sorting domain-containing protein [Limisphaerales bacterium]
MKKAILAGACVLGALVQTAFAVSCGDSNTIGNVVGGGTDSYDDCAGWFSGNINGNAAELTAIASEFGGTSADWTYQGKSDDAGNGPFGSNPSVTSGTVTFDTPVTSAFVVGIKGGPSYSFYYFLANAAGIESIDFDTLGIVKGNGNPSPELSHLALYTMRSSGTEVPDSGSMVALMGLGLAGLAMIRRQARLS